MRILHKLWSLVIPVALVFLAGAYVTGVFASEPLPPVVENAFTAIQSNQKFISDNRKIVEEWEARKTNNSVQIGIMLAHCYDFDWSAMKPVKKSDCAKESLPR